MPSHLQYDTMLVQGHQESNPYQQTCDADPHFLRSPLTQRLSHKRNVIIYPYNTQTTLTPANTENTQTLSSDSHSKDRRLLAAWALFCLITNLSEKNGQAFQKIMSPSRAVLNYLGNQLPFSMVAFKHKVKLNYLGGQLTQKHFYFS